MIQGAYALALLSSTASPSVIQSDPSHHSSDRQNERRIDRKTNSKGNDIHHDDSSVVKVSLWHLGQSQRNDDRYNGNQRHSADEGFQDSYCLIFTRVYLVSFSNWIHRHPIMYPMTNRRR